MALKLTILSEHSAPAGARGSIVFGVGGGSIGRAHDNDWVLPDPERYLSAHHARVQFRDGTFHLFDTSTNGVFVNASSQALGRRASHALRDGDRLRLGDYRIGVSIDAEAQEAPEASEIFPVRHAPAAGQLPGIGADLEADFNMSDLLRPEPAANGRSAPTADAGLLAFDQSERRPAPARAAVTSAARADPRVAADTAGIEAFCRGAGINAQQFSPEAHARVLQLAGLMLREALVGLKGLALTQRDARDHSHIEVSRDDPQQIGLTGLPVEDLLNRLLLGNDTHQLDAVQWLRDTLASTRRHDLAFARALRAALADFLARLDPAAAGGADAAALSERFRSITDMSSGKLPHLFSEAFARVFAAEFNGAGS